METGGIPGGWTCVLMVLVSVGFARSGVRGWLKLDFGLSLLTGISLVLTPHVLLGIQTDVMLDAVSLHMARVVGLIFVSSSYCMHHGIYTKTACERLSIVRSRLVSAFMILIASIYAQVHYHEWNEYHLQFTTFGALIWMAMHAHYGFKSCSKPPVLNKSSDFFLMLDHAATLLVGVTWFAFPQWLLRHQSSIRPNAVSVHISRILGSLLTGGAMLSESATRFPTLRGRNYVLISRIFAAGPLLFLVVQAQLLGNFRAPHLFVGVATAAAWAANAFFGYIVLNYTRERSQSARDAFVREDLPKNSTQNYGNSLALSPPSLNASYRANPAVLNDAC